MSPVGVPTIVLSSPPVGGVTPSPRSVWIDNLTGAVYQWPLNHTSEDSLKTLGRRVTRSGNARNVRLIHQATHPGPARLVLHGFFLDRAQAQYAEFVSVFEDCDDRTFTYIDASGDSYQVIVIQFDARRQQGAGRADGSYFSYQLELEILSVNQGALLGYVV